MRFDRDLEMPTQRNSWSCLPSSLAWAVRALGVDVETRTLGISVLRNRVITPRGYLVDKTGTDLGGWGDDLLATHGLAAHYVYDADFDQVADDAGLFPLVIGSGSWLHYAAVRDYDAAADRLLLANSSPGWQGVGQTMDRRQFARYRPISLTRIAPPEIIGQIKDEDATSPRHDRMRQKPSHALYLPRMGEGWAQSGDPRGVADRLLAASDRRHLLHELRRQQPTG